MKQILASSDRYSYQLRMFFLYNPEEDFVVVSFDDSPRGQLMKERYGKFVVHKSGRATFGKGSVDDLAKGITESLDKPWHGIVEEW